MTRMECRLLLESRLQSDNSVREDAVKYQRLLVCVALAAAVSACNSANPAEPSSSVTATVNGSIVPAGGSSSGATAGVNSGSISAASTTPPGLLVSVAGTAI